MRINCHELFGKSLQECSECPERVMSLVLMRWIAYLRRHARFAETELMRQVMTNSFALLVCGCLVEVNVVEWICAS